MTQLKNTDTIVVSNGVGRLKNPYTQYSTWGYLGVYPERQEWQSFEQTAIANQFSTDAPDGEYLLSDFWDEQILQKSTSAIAGKIKCVKFRSLTQPKEITAGCIEFCTKKYGNACKVCEYGASSTQPKPVGQPEVKGETVEEAANSFFLSDDRARCWPKDTIIHVFTAGASWSDQRHAAEREELKAELSVVYELSNTTAEANLKLESEREVLVKRVKDLESDMQRIIHETHSATKAYQIATEALNQKD